MRTIYVILGLLAFTLAGCFSAGEDVKETRAPESQKGAGTGLGVGGTGYDFYTVSAAVKTVDNPTAAIASCLDGLHNTHIVWVENDGVVDVLKYMVFDARSKRFGKVSNVIKAKDGFSLHAVDIVVDNMNTPHLTYVERGETTDYRTKSGNVQVYYATQNEATDFETTKVSTNPVNPNENTDNIYNANYKAKPSIALKSGKTPVVVYVSDNQAASKKAFKAIVATQESTDWSYEVVEMSRLLAKKFNHDYGFAINAYGAVECLGATDKLDYEVATVSKGENGTWGKMSSLSGDIMASSTDNLHPQLFRGVDGTQHLFWFNSKAKEYGHAIFKNGAYELSEPFAVKGDMMGSYYPVALDRFNDKPVYYYQGIAGGFITTYDAKGKVQTTKIDDTKYGIPCGDQVLDAANGYVSLVLTNDKKEEITIMVNNADISGDAILN